MTRLRCAVGITVCAALFAWPISAQAQNSDYSAENQGVGRAGFEESSIFDRNPSDISSQLVTDDRKKDPLIPTPGLDRLLTPWFDFKAMLDQRYGLQFGLSYNALDQHASDSKSGVDQAAGGVFDIIGTWTLFGRDSGWQGLFGFRVADQHKLGTAVQPEGFGDELGSAWGMSIGFQAIPFIPLELWWEQHFANDRVIVRAGKIDPSGIFDPLKLGNSFEGFLSNPFTFNPSIAFPGEGLGIVAAIQLLKNVVVMGGVFDANGDGRHGADSFFDKKEHFKIIEAAWTPEFASGSGDYHVTLWQSDERVIAEKPKGQGFTLSAEQEIGNILPFIRYGHSTGGAAPLKNMVAGGVGLLRFVGRQNDVLGLGLSWGEPSDKGQRDQYGGEIYYRVQVTNEISVTPDLQLIFDPADNPADDQIAIFSIRLRADL